MRQKTVEKKKEKKRMASEIDLENTAAPLVELSDRFMEEMELAVGNLSRINKVIWTLVGGVKDLVEVMRRKELLETDGEQEVAELRVQTEEELEMEKVEKEIGMKSVGEEEKGNEVEKEDGVGEMEKGRNGEE
jgi:hypothetical protein